MDARAFAAPKGLRPRRQVKPGHDERMCGGGYSFFGTTRNVPLARAMTASSALIRLCAKQMVLPVLITSHSTASHCPICALPTKSTASETVTNDVVQPVTSAQL